MNRLSQIIIFIHYVAYYQIESFLLFKPVYDAVHRQIGQLLS